MRAFGSGWMLVAVMATAGGCASHKGAKPDARPVTQTASHTTGTADTLWCVMKAGGHDVLRLTLPTNAKCTPRDGSLSVESHTHEVVNIWLVPDAKTVDEGAARVEKVIDREFRDFQATGTTATTIAGAPAKRLAGSGVEADDRDPGTADVVVFKVTNHTFIACTHGEYLSPDAQKWMMTVVQTAQKP